MNENVLVKENEFEKPLIHKIDSVIDNCIRDCHNNYFHTFDHVCVYNIKLTININNGMINLTISDKNLSLYELNKKLKITRERGFIFTQINKLTIKFYSNISHINIHYCLKLRIPIMQRNFFEIIS